MTTRSHTITIAHRPVRNLSEGLTELTIDGHAFSILLEECRPTRWRVRILEGGEKWAGAEDIGIVDVHEALWDTIGCVCDALAAEREERTG